MPASKENITATLIRGKTYVFRGIKFTRGDAIEVDSDIAAELETKVDIVMDLDGEEFEKPLFAVNGFKQSASATSDKKIRRTHRRRVRK
jgi:hypothetical protein